MEQNRTSHPKYDPITGERVFYHTGIRIMRSDDGALLFCDSGAFTGVRDSFIIEPEALRAGSLPLVESELLRYIQTHEQARTQNESFSFSPSTHAN